MAEAAGRLVRNGFDRPFASKGDGTTGDVVTSLDVAAEQLIIKNLRAAFPCHSILSEESGVAWQASSPWTWLVDPLDGSNNIVVGMPVVAIGLALCHDGLPVVSVVHEPFVARTWSAVHGSGAWQTGHRPLRRLSNGSRFPVVAWTQGYGITPEDRTVSALRAGLKRYARRVLELWAPLCAWTMLARGDIEGIVGYRVGELDLHAGALIATMTGVEIRDFSGSPFDARFGGLAETRSLVAAVPERIGELLDLVAQETLKPIE